MGKEKEFRQREWFVYDKDAQKNMSEYARFLIESALRYEEFSVGSEPECHCLIAVGNSYAYMEAEEASFIETNDIEALRRMVAAIEEVKFGVLSRIQRLRELDDDNRAG